MSVLSSIEEIGLKAREELSRVEDEKSLEQWRIAFMGRKSPLQSVLRSLGELSADERRGDHILRHTVRHRAGGCAGRKAQLEAFREGLHRAGVIH